MTRLNITISQHMVQIEKNGRIVCITDDRHLERIQQMGAEIEEIFNEHTKKLDEMAWVDYNTFG